MKSLIPDWIQNPLLPITVTVIGAGGSGSMFIRELARIAYTYHKVYNRRMQVTVVDGDTITLANCGRQLFGENEVMMNKAETLVSKVNRFYGFNWIADNRYFQYPHADVDKNTYFSELSANFIISAVDKIGIRDQIATFFKDGQAIKGNPEYFPHFWLDMGNKKTVSQMVVGSYTMEWPTIMEYPMSVEEDQLPSCSLAEAIANQDLFVNTRCASTAAKWLWECLTKPEIDWRGAFENLDTLRIAKLKIQKPHAEPKGDLNREHTGELASKPAIHRKHAATNEKRPRKAGTGSGRRGN